MSGKTFKILFGRSFELFLQKPSINASFKRSKSAPNVFAAAALKQRCFEDNLPEAKRNLNFDFQHDKLSGIPSATFVNRNPRNPEYFGYNKQRGYSTQYKKRNFFKR